MDNNARPTYTSAHLIARDKIVLDKHQKELAAKDRRIQRLKYANDETLKQLYDAQIRGNRLAESLGFTSIYEAQVCIDTADHDTSYRDCFERVGKLEDELATQKAENERLREHLALIEKEPVHSKSATEAAPSSDGYLSLYESACEELSQVKSRLNDLIQEKDRLVAEHAVDYNKWKKFRIWLFSEDDAYKGMKREELSSEEKKSLMNTTALKKRKTLQRFGIEMAEQDPKYRPPSIFPPIGRVSTDEVDKENRTMSPPERKKRRISEVSISSDDALDASFAAMPSSPLFSFSYQLSRPSAVKSSSTAIHIAPSASPNMFMDPHPTTRPRAPLTSQTNRQSLKTEFSSPPCKAFNTRSKKLKAEDSLVPGSSDTEADSQADGLFPIPTPGFKLPALPVSVNRHQQNDNTKAFTTPRENAKAPLPFGLPTPAEDTPVSQLQDRRRASSDAAQPLCPSSKENAAKTETLDSSSAASQAKESSSMLTLTPANPGGSSKGQKQLDDYSAYKGRGRYAKNVQSTRKSINSTFVIDPSKNGGVGFQYDEVVRTRDDRKKMEAGDCECCSEYYKAVGPLPPRLQQPLWRSPKKPSPNPCAMHGQAPKSDSANELDNDRKAIDAHKKAISRHRHHWARGNTPPAYWNIGFPDTQEAEEINAQAMEMHKQKQARIEEAVNRGDGKYIKRT